MLRSELELGVEDYLRNNSGEIGLRDSLEEALHQRLLNEVVRNLDKLGFYGVPQLYREVRLIEDGIEIGRVDLVTYSSQGMFVIEGKTIRRKTRGNSRNQINRQLRRAYEFFKKNFEVEPRMIGVYRFSRAKNFRYYELQKPK